MNKLLPSIDDHPIQQVPLEVIFISYHILSQHTISIANMVKPRIGQQFKEKILRSPKGASSKNSADLEFLAGQFKQLKIKIRQLIEALKAQHVSLLRMNESRVLVSEQMQCIFLEL